MKYAKACKREWKQRKMESMWIPEYFSYTLTKKENQKWLRKSEINISIHT